MPTSTVRQGPARARRQRVGSVRDIEGYMRTVERLLSEQRDFHALTPQAIADASRVSDSDVTRAIALWEHANAGQAPEQLLNATPYEGPWD